MSSHHIIREDQEPALILEDLRGLDESLLDQLLEWSPTVVIPHELADDMIARQTKFDVAIGKIPPTRIQDAVRFIQSEAPFSDAAIRYLASKGYRAAYLASPHTDPKVLLSYTPGITVTLFSQGIRYYPIRSGFAKWKPAGEMVYIPDTDGMEFTGLIPIDGQRFQTTEDGLITFLFPYGHALIGEPY